MPDDVRQAKEKERHAWLFQQASIWPDMIRGTGEENERGRYNRSKWHYVNWPLFFSEAEKNNLAHGISVNIESDPALVKDASEMNIFQAINYNTSILKDRAAADEDRAVALCWITHLVQDIHQPLHTTALFTSGRFRSGDRGGNLIPLSGQGEVNTLHAFWDSTVGGTQSNKMIRRRAAFLISRFRQIGSDATGSMSLDTWFRENNQLILKYVYTPEIRAGIKQAEGNAEQLQPISLTPGYRDQAEEVAEIRVVEASFRLAYLLNQLQVK